ncbi:hypothetical protein FKM82_028836, partial [Ascaphus truei]
YAFLVTAAVQFAGGLIIFFGLVTSPKEVGLPETGEGESEGGSPEEESNRPLISGDNDEEEDLSYSVQASDSTNAPVAIGFLQACCLPGVLLVSAEHLYY